MWSFVAWHQSPSQGKTTKASVKQGLDIIGKDISERENILIGLEKDLLDLEKNLLEQEKHLLDLEKDLLEREKDLLEREKDLHKP